MEYIRLDMAGQPVHSSFSLLYIGYITENFLFSLGLGKRQKLILDERNNAQSELISQIRHNEMLERQFRTKLEMEVTQLKTAVEQDAMERLGVQFEKNIAELKLASLRNQMNPHFIFNSLNSIKGYIIDNDREQAVFYLNKFSKLIRMILSSSIEKDVSLAEEIEIAELYLQVENIRFNNEIHFETHIAPELSNSSIKVPALILQPFLENAIWHGLSTKKGERKLTLNIKKDGNFLEFQVKDNGIGRKAAIAIKNQKLLKRESYGIKLTEERLRIFGESYQGEVSIVIEDLMSEDGEAIGTVVRIKLPIVFN
jgi:sensor histidine kinase YesM